VSSTETEETEVGFELDGDFYRWSVSDSAKDLMLIDRFTQMPAHQFFEIIEDNFDRGRGPILLAMMATSIRRAHPDWSIERVARMVMNLSLTDVTFIGSDEEVEEAPKSKAVPESAESSGSSSEKSNGSQEPVSKKSPKTQP
jgi:hypothetical protein